MHPPGNQQHIFNKGTLLLALGALGVVYGDIGTSPLYAIRECFHGKHAISLTEGNIFGVMSLVFWALIVVICVKYVIFILLADNHGEGGIFALLALISAGKRKVPSGMRSVALAGGMIGAGLLYGDGIITPAISVLSAIEGIEVATKAAAPLIVPLTCSILILLFIFQHHGSAMIGKIFGPVMILWFGVISILGLVQIFKEPQILLAINPIYAYEFFFANQLHGLVVLGSVVLCFTGGEALYADLGHFGRKAIRLSWLGLVFPALLCNYFGQGALLLVHPQFIANPFYGLAPQSLLYPMVVLATVATVIASQALISGIFSLTQQAIELGFCPRLRIIHTSHQMKGQIYLPGVNYSLMVACLAVVIGFGGSSGLAGAYGLAVTATMAVTSVLFFMITAYLWKWPLWKSIPLLALFLFFDLSYFGANLFKVADGGWFTLLCAALLTVIMTSWRRGREEVIRRIGTRIPLETFLNDVAKHNIPRVKGTAVFMTLTPQGTSPVLLHHLKHNKLLHEKVILLSILSADVPSVPIPDRVKVEDLGQGFYRVLAYNGFMQTPHVPEILNLASKFGLDFDEAETTYYLGRVTVFTDGNSKLRRFRKSLFAFMARNADLPGAYFGLPANRVVELGTQISI
jgi:KUP system potassium uptake protein